VAREALRVGGVVLIGLEIVGRFRLGGHAGLEQVKRLGHAGSLPTFELREMTRTAFVDTHILGSNRKGAQEEPHQAETPGEPVKSNSH
jgi:hypothetical protein